MALDPSGNWIPGPFQETPFPPPSANTMQEGVGVPSISTPVTLVYVNSSNGDIYTNPTLTAGAWVKVGGSGGSGVPHGNGSPISLGTPVSPATVFIDDLTGNFWAVVKGAWVELIGN